MDLIDALEQGIEGERAHSEWGVEQMRLNGIRRFMNTYVVSNSSSPRKLEDYFTDFIASPLWWSSSEMDELFFLEHFQKQLEAVRKLKAPTPWPT
jgi:hypothetical protein